MDYSKLLSSINELIQRSNSILIIQADNPDGDSIASALALESILGSMGKSVSLYCGVETPGYLKYIDGWSRISDNIPNEFDLSIIVDTSSSILLGKIKDNNNYMKVKNNPVIIIDHHQNVKCDIEYADIILNDYKYASTGEVIYMIAKKFKWPVDQDFSKYVFMSILSDTLGLSTESATPQTFRTVAEILENGVSRTKIEESRKELSKMEEKVFRYKADLIKRTRFYHNNKIALIILPEEELFDVGTLYNPGPLITNDLLMVKNVEIVIIIKVYKNRITGSIRANPSAPVAGELSEKYGGGGHQYAAGFKIENFNQNLELFINDLVKDTVKLI